MKYNVRETGLDGKRLGTVKGDIRSQAVTEACRRWDRDESELILTPVEERVDVNCERCGWKYKAVKTHVEHGYRSLCVVCQQSDLVEHKAHLFLKAQDKFRAMVKERAKKLGIRPEDAEIRFQR